MTSTLFEAKAPARPDAPGGGGAVPPVTGGLERLGGGRRNRRHRLRLPKWFVRLSGPALVFIIWYSITAGGLVDKREVASPGSVLSAARSLWRSGDLQTALSASLARVLVGVAIGIVIGVTLALIAGFLVWGENTVDSSMNLLRTIPVTAIVPLAVVWFGLGESAKIFIITLGVVFPVYMNTFAAIRNVDVKLIESGRAFGLGHFGIIRRVLLPGALPGFLVGLRWGLGAAWLLLVFAETINAQHGLGVLLDQAVTWLRTDIIFLVLVIYGLLGLACDAVVRILERVLLRWRRGFVGL